MSISKFQDLIQEKLRAMARPRQEPTDTLYTFILERKHPFGLKDKSDEQLTSEIDDTQIPLLQSIHTESTLSVRPSFIDIDCENYEEVGRLNVIVKEFLLVGGSKVEGLHTQFTIHKDISHILTDKSQQYLARILNSVSKNWNNTQSSDTDLLQLIDDQDRLEIIRARSKAHFSDEALDGEETILDEDSLRLLRKTRPFIDKSDLFGLMVKKNINDNKSKRIVRHLIFPDESPPSHISETNVLTVQKKTFSQQTIKEMLRIYK